MSKEYTALGLMSGTSGDGVDASIIQSDGQNKCKLISDKYFEYDRDIYKNIHELKSISNIDGYLIGGASQNPKKFIDIIKKTYI